MKSKHFAINLLANTNTMVPKKTILSESELMSLQTRNKLIGTTWLSPTQEKKLARSYYRAETLTEVKLKI